MRRKSWPEFSLYLGRVLILLLLLAVLLPKVAAVFGIWMSSIRRDDQKPHGNPMRVQTLPWSQFVMHLFPDGQKQK